MATLKESAPPPLNQRVRWPDMQLEVPSLGRALSMGDHTRSPRRVRVACSVPSSPAPLDPGALHTRLPRVQSEPCLRTRDYSRLRRLYAYTPRVRAGFVAEAACPPRRSFSIVIERKRIHPGAPVRTEISFDSSVILRTLVVLLLLGTSTAYVALPAAASGAHLRPTAAIAPAARAAVGSITLGDAAILQDVDSGRSSVALLTPPVGARASFVHACLAASERVATGVSPFKPPAWLLNGLTEGACAAAFPQTFFAMRSWHTDRALSARAELDLAARQLEERLSEVLPFGSFEVQTRVKSLSSLFEKVWLRGKTATDLLALRVVLADSPRDEWQISPLNRPHSRCLDVRGLAGDLWAERDFKDYIQTPKRNGYCSIHMQVRLASGADMELQVRTRRMHRNAETGSAAHARYKEEAMAAAARRGGWEGWEQQTPAFAGAAM